MNHLSRSIEQARSDRSLTWAEISREVGVATSTIRRFAHATDAEADGVLALIRWLGETPEYFILNSQVAGVPLPVANDGVIRVDMALLTDLPAWPGRSRAGGRTTIQQLAIVAQASRAPMASLTRWSPI